MFCQRIHYNNTIYIFFYYFTKQYKQYTLYKVYTRIPDRPPSFYINTNARSNR